MANLILENRQGSRFWREVGAAAVSPPTGLNRWAYGDDREPVFSSHDAEYYSRAQIGVSHAVTERDAGNGNAVRANEALAEFAIDYGLPGKTGYDYTRPFDHFAFQATTSTSSSVENIITRGSLLVRPYELGPRYRGIVGLYGGYDYLAPPTFRLSSTSLSLGSTGQWNASDALTMQGSALVGVGYAAVGSVNTSNDRDYQYGVTPQTVLSARAIVDNLWSFDVAAREYFVSHVGSNTGRPGTRQRGAAGGIADLPRVRAARRHGEIPRQLSGHDVRQRAVAAPDALDGRALLHVPRARPLRRRRVLIARGLSPRRGRPGPVRRRAAPRAPCSRSPAIRTRAPNRRRCRRPPARTACRS